MACQIYENDSPISLPVNDKIPSLKVVSTDPDQLFSGTDISLVKSHEEKIVSAKEIILY